MTGSKESLGSGNTLGARNGFLSLSGEKNKTARTPLGSVYSLDSQR